MVRALLHEAYVKSREMLGDSAECVAYGVLSTLTSLKQAAIALIQFVLAKDVLCSAQSPLCEERERATASSAELVRGDLRRQGSDQDGELPLG